MTHDKSQFYGLDPEYSREASQGMQASADDLRGVVSDISAVLDSVLWIGPAAHRFKQDWDGSLRPELQAACDSLTDNGRELYRRAELQDEVSR